MAIKKGDFIEIDYVGTLKNTEEIFDLTKAAVAKEKGITNERGSYEPKIICVGQQDVVPGLDAFFVGKDIGKTYTIELDAVDAFGKKNPKLIKLVPTSVFKKQKINPFPGLQVNMDNLFGIIKTVSGGRVLVDFNHPLSGKDVTYEVDIKRIITDTSEKVKSIIRRLIGKDVSCTIKDTTATIHEEFPDIFKKMLTDKIRAILPSLKDVKFIKKEEKPKASTES